MSFMDLKGKTILVTGAAGFIGSNLVKRLYSDVEDVTVIGIDNMNDYYDVRLKDARLEELSEHLSFIFVKGSIADKALITEVFEKYKPQVVVNLAAQAGVRYSITNPDAYIESKPSARGELEITDLNRIYLEDGSLNVELLGQGFTWLDTGTHESLVDATNFVKTVEQHQHRKIACLEEIAYLNGWISKDELMEVYEVMKKNQYGQYLKDVMDGKYQEHLY